jgi:RNA polymerase sigma-70 factor (ECF subfamily)
MSDLEHVWLASRRRWPSIDVAADVFASYAAARSGPHLEELYLCCALVAGDAAALAVFDAEYIAALDRALARYGDPALVDDTKQVLRERLLVRDGDTAPRIAAFSGKGSLASWLEVAALRTAISLQRKQRDQPVEDRTLTLLRGVGLDPQLAHLKQTYVAALTTAWRAALRALSASDRTLLRLHVLDKLTVDRLGILYGVHATTAARWLRQLRERLGDDVRARLASTLRVDDAELASIFALIHSQMEITLGELLSEDRDLQNTSHAPR